MIHEPVQVEQSLIDDVLVGVAFVLEHDRRVVLVYTEAVDAAGLVLVFPRMVDDVLRLQEPDAEEGLHVRLDELLLRVDAHLLDAAEAAEKQAAA